MRITPRGARVAGAALCAIRSTRGNGSGFAFLAPGWIVTARHVVAALPPGAPVHLAFADGDHVARVVFEHPRIDLAVLEVTGGRANPAALLPALDDPRGDPLVVLTAAESDGAPGHDVARYEHTVRQRDGHKEVLFHFPAPERTVRSGSPLVAASGRVVAVVTDGITLDGRRMIRSTSIMGLSAWWTRTMAARP